MTGVLARLAGACTPVVFKQFLHWILMQYLSKYTPDIPIPPPYARPPLLSEFEDDQVRELYFKVVADILDGAVADLAPDLFRMIDINDDGTITAEEWAKCKKVFECPEPRAVISFLFKLLVCLCTHTNEFKHSKTHMCGSESRTMKPLNTCIRT